MKWYNRPQELKGLIFDMDNTLYANADYTKHQEQVLIERLALERSESPEETQNTINLWRQRFMETNAGRKPSLGNTFLAFGIPISTSIKWRENLICPEKYLQADSILKIVLCDLKRSYSLAVVTNNPVKTAIRTFAVLGIETVIPVIVGLDTLGVSKPCNQAFAYAANQMGINHKSVLSIGDRYEIDLEPAISLGMGGLLIETIDEIYNLRTIL